MKRLGSTTRPLSVVFLTIPILSIGLAGCDSPTTGYSEAPREVAPEPFGNRNVLVNIPWRARIASSPEGAEVYLFEEGKAGALLGKTPLEVDIMTDFMGGYAGGPAVREVTLHLPVIRTNDGFHRGFMIKKGDVQVERDAFLPSALQARQPQGGVDPVGGLALGGAFRFPSGSLGMYKTTMPASYAKYEKESPPPHISEIMVDFAAEAEKPKGTQP